MQPRDKPTFGKILQGLAAIKPGTGGQLSPEAIEIFWLALSPSWPLDEFRAAASHLAMTEEFMPNPYHFAQLRKATRPLAGEAWAKVLRFARWDYRQSGDHLSDIRQFDPVTLKAVNAIGGFRAIATGDAGASHFLEKRFAENYDALQDVTETRAALPQLSSSTNGHASAQSVLAKTYAHPEGI